MVLIQGNPTICAHVESNLCYMITQDLSLVRGQSKIDLFSPKRPIFLHACATGSELPSNNNNNYIS